MFCNYIRYHNIENEVKPITVTVMLMAAYSYRHYIFPQLLAMLASYLFNILSFYWKSLVILMTLKASN